MHLLSSVFWLKNKKFLTFTKTFLRRLDFLDFSYLKTGHEEYICKLIFALLFIYVTLKYTIHIELLYI